MLWLKQILSPSNGPIAKSNRRPNTTLTDFVLYLITLFPVSGNLHIFRRHFAQFFVEHIPGPSQSARASGTPRKNELWRHTIVTKLWRSACVFSAYATGRTKWSRELLVTHACPMLITIRNAPRCLMSKLVWWQWKFICFTQIYSTVAENTRHKKSWRDRTSDAPAVLPWKKDAAYRSYITLKKPAPLGKCAPVQSYFERVGFLIVLNKTLIHKKKIVTTTSATRPAFLCIQSTKMPGSSLSNYGKKPEQCYFRL